MARKPVAPHEGTDDGPRSPAPDDSTAREATDRLPRGGQGAGGTAGSLGAQGDRAEGPWKRHRGPRPPHEPSCGRVPATGPSHSRPYQLGSVNCNLSLCISAQKLNSVFPLLQIEIKPINGVHRSLINATSVTTSDTGKRYRCLTS